MNVHIKAERHEVADTVLLPGDPLRARFIAETMLTDARCYNRVRGMLGYTGFYKTKRISVQATGMGVPSVSIYAHELVSFYGAKTLIRVGSCGALLQDLALKDIVVALSACTDSNVNRLRFSGMDYAPSADFGLLERAVKAARECDARFKVGSVFTSDAFYTDDPDWWRPWAKYGVMAVEMETSALYTICSGAGAKALALLSVSDNLVTGERLSPDERETGLGFMARVALETAL